MLTIIVKGTGGCNLACSYCSLGKKTEFKYADEEKMIEIFRYACNVCEARQEKKITFILHGGEPTLISTAIYKKAIDAVKEEYPNIEITISMQTNGFVMSDEMIQFIKEYDIHIGISIDGSEKIHDSERTTIVGAATYRTVIYNIEKLLEENIRVSCLMVLTSNALSEGYEYIRFFEDKGLHLKINPLLNYGEAYEHPELSLNSGDYSHYLIGLYEYIIANDVHVQIAPIDSILQAIISSERISECSFNSECNQHFLCIDFYGDIYPCGKYSDMNDYKLGNIKEKRYDIFESSILKRLGERRTIGKPEKCNKCKYVKLCNAGCSAEASIDGDITKAPMLCKDYEILFNYFYTDGLKLLKGELIRQKKMLGAMVHGV